MPVKNYCFCSVLSERCPEGVNERVVESGGLVTKRFMLHERLDHESKDTLMSVRDARIMVTTLIAETVLCTVSLKCCGKSG